jgi:hypothetical protein
MTADELLQHPEYNHTIWDLKPEKKGKVAVANGRGGPIDIAYEVHGSGDRHLVVSLLYIWYSLAATSHVRIRSAVQHHLSYIRCSEPDALPLCSPFGSLPPGTFCFGRMDRLTTSPHVSRLMFLSTRSLSYISTYTFIFQLIVYVYRSLRLLLMTCPQSSQDTLLTPCSGSWALVG